jgi:hypothetical protein
LIEPKVITDYNQEIACVLPAGFRFGDARWEKIWAAFEGKGTTLTLLDLSEMFPN